MDFRNRNSIGFLSSISEELLIPLYINNSFHNQADIYILLLHNQYKNHRGTKIRLVDTPYYSLPTPGMFFNFKKAYSKYYNIQVDNHGDLIKALEGWIIRCTAFARLNRNYKLADRIITNGECLIQHIAHSDVQINNNKEAFSFLIHELYSMLLKNEVVKIINIEIKAGIIVDIEKNELFKDKSELLLAILANIANSLNNGQIIYINRHKRRFFQIKIDNVWGEVQKIHKKNKNEVEFFTENNSITIYTDNNIKQITLSKKDISLDLILHKDFTNLILAPFGMVSHIPWYIETQYQSENTIPSENSINLDALQFIKPFWPKSYSEPRELNSINGSTIIDYCHDKLIEEYLTIFLGNIELEGRIILKLLLSNITGRASTFKSSYSKTSNLYKFLLKAYKNQNFKNIYIFNNERNCLVQLFEIALLFRMVRKNIYESNIFELKDYIRILRAQGFCEENGDLVNSFYERIIQTMHLISRKYRYIYVSCQIQIELILEKLKAFIKQTEQINILQKKMVIVIYRIERLFVKLIRSIFVLIAELFNNCLHVDIWLLFLVSGTDQLNSTINSIVSEREVSVEIKNLTIKGA